MSERAQRGRALWKRIQPYVEPRTLRASSGRLLKSVPVVVDYEIKRGHPFMNPDRDEVRMHPSDYNDLCGYIDQRVVEMTR